MPDLSPAMCSRDQADNDMSVLLRAGEGEGAEVCKATAISVSGDNVWDMGNVCRDD